MSMSLSDAVISPCGRYRYRLRRSTGFVGPTLAWLMLNPSTADHAEDDPTIRKVISFTRRNGYGVAAVVNLFAWRETDSKVLRRVISNVGPNGHILEGDGNRQAITETARECDALVCAWGAQSWAQAQGDRVLEWLAEDAPSTRLLCLGRAKGGEPLHPLMPSYDGHPLVPYTRQSPHVGDSGGSK